MANAGKEDRNDATDVCQIGGAANAQTHGVVPWLSLGLAELDVTDGWGNRLTYRVAPELVADNAMDFTACDPGAPSVGGPLSACATPCPSGAWPAGCTNPRDVTQSKGLKVRNLTVATPLVMDPDPVPVTPNPPPPSTGAAYVVISHGENTQGAYNNQGILQGGSTASGTLEAANNAANVAFTSPTSSASAAFVDDFPVFVEGAGHFDDSVLRPSILTVATKAQLGPRAH